MAIEHTVTARAAGRSLTLAELDAFLKLASEAGALPDDLATSPLSLSRGLGSVSVTITSPAPVQVREQDPATVETTLLPRPTPSPRKRTGQVTP